MKCVLSWCGSEADEPSYFCMAHITAWVGSGEAQRFSGMALECAGDHLPLHDFIRRLEAERRTHVVGGGK